MRIKPKLLGFACIKDVFCTIILSQQIMPMMSVCKHLTTTVRVATLYFLLALFNVVFVGG